MNVEKSSPSKALGSEMISNLVTAMGCGVGERHPKVGSGVLLGAGACLLGNITIGEGSKIGSGSVVMTDVPPHTTFAGVPAKQVGKPVVDQPALAMNQRWNP